MFHERIKEGGRAYPGPLAATCGSGSKTYCKSLCQKPLMEALEEELSEVKGLGEAQARTIRRALEGLEELGVPEGVG